MRTFALVAVIAAASATAILSPGVASAAPDLGALPLRTHTVTELTSFTSPSGNIGCYIDIGEVRCDIRERDWTPPPKPASCSDYTGWGQGLQLSVGEPAGFVCAGDTALTPGDTLPFGDTIMAGPIQCESKPTGITCWDSQHGGEFRIAREGYELT